MKESTVSDQPISRYLLPDDTALLENDVHIGGVSLRQLAQTYGTPLFVYDEQTLRQRARAAAASFSPGTAFASKSFLCGAMARLVVEEGLYVDVATGGELDVVLRAGIEPARIVVHGNNKLPEELDRAIALGVHRLVVDNFDEIARVRERMDSGRTLDCLVRVTPGVEAHTHEFVRTGQEDSKFGFSLASGAAEAAMNALAQIPGVRVRGVHFHIGSQIFDGGGFEEALSLIAELVRRSGAEELCVGGGLGVAYVEGERAMSIEEWAKGVRTAAERLGIDPAVRITAEPGRAIVAQAGVTLYRVGTVKDVPQRRYVAVDGGMSDNPRPVLYGSGYEAFDIAQPLSRRTQRVRIVGRHCESGDVLIDEAWLPESTGVGSVLATPVTGAYGYSMASNYNRVVRPAVVFVHEGRARVVLRRETLDDLVRLEVEPEGSSDLG